ncbi:MAG: serine/threonine protein kinase [Polyangiaceae bacterium]|nr:serine/threonine protein kinase [Polyangiaceae bacterium]
MSDPRHDALRRKRYEADDLVGDKYVLVRPLGEGGMGTVWVAQDQVLDVHVAIKLVALEAGDGGGQARRMLEEARTAARLVHAAIVRILDFGVTRLGDPYLAMELLHGEDLADLLARERCLPPLSAVSTLLPIAHALATAHEAGIIHRDVKPENIFLATTDVGIQPKLLDFGIARFTDRVQRLTLEGAVLGTPDYLAPEQARGQKVTPAADLWSFCVVLYELVAGVCPFQAPGYYELLQAIVENEPVSLAERGVDEPELWQILERGLSKQAPARYPSLRDLGQRLAEWALSRGLNEDVTGTSLRRTWLREADVAGHELPGAADGGTPIAVRVGAEAGGAAIPPVDLARIPQSAARVSFGDDEVPIHEALAALAAVSELGDPDDLFARVSRRRYRVVAAFLVAIVALGAALLLAEAGVLVGWACSHGGVGSPAAGVRALGRVTGGPRSGRDRAATVARAWQRARG